MYTAREDSIHFTHENKKVQFDYWIVQISIIYLKGHSKVDVWIEKEDTRVRVIQVRVIFCLIGGLSPDYTSFKFLIYKLAYHFHLQMMQ